MSYQSQIGRRYLYRRDPARRSVIGFAVSALLSAGLAYQYFSSAEPSGAVAILLVGSMLAMVLFGLLRYFTVFTSVSVAGVVLGVAALTVVLAVTTGFQEQFREKVLGVNAHILIRKSSNDFRNYQEVEELVLESDPDVVAVQPFQFVEMQATRGRGEVAGVAIKGVDPDRVTKVLDIEDHMIEGEVAVLNDRPADGTPPPIIIGREVGKKLDAKVGDVITVVSPLATVSLGRWSPSGRPPKTKRFTVRGIFYAGFEEYDRRLMYAHLEEVQDLLELGDIVLGVEMRVADVERAPEIADKIEKALGGAPFYAEDWNELNRNLFRALFLQKFALLVVLTLIIAVAAFNMVSALTMMVIDKTREIAILKSMGATSNGIAGVFQVVGLMIGGVGTSVGLVLGLAICAVVSHYGYALDPKVYLIDSLPIRVRWPEVMVVCVITMGISALATYIPAQRASALPPVDGLRYE